MAFIQRAVTLFAAAALAVGGLPGCAKDNSGDASRDRTGPALPPPRAANEQNANEKLRSAEDAERRGDYARAMEGYEQLRSFPEAARPKDLDARIERLRTKMNATPQR